MDFINNSLTFGHLRDLGFKTINLIQLKFTTAVYIITGNIILEIVHVNKSRGSFSRLSLQIIQIINQTP